MRKIVGWTMIGFLIYIALACVYIFYMNDSILPKKWIGTSADPQTFMNARELMITDEYSKLRDVLFFISLPYDWIIFLLVLAFGLSKRFSYWAKDISKNLFFQTVIYVFWLSVVSLVLSFPLNFIKYQISKNYRITTQPFEGWMKDQFINFWLQYALMTLVVCVVYLLMRRFKKRWWLFAWLLSVPFTLFITFIQPVVIDPLYNQFYPLKDKVLEEKILTLADQAHIPTDHVYEVNMSEKTNALNAYVTGIGSNSRIVLWDTTLQQLKDKEILFIMAHEMGHYVMKHVYIGIAGYLLLSLIGFYIISKIAEKVVHKWKEPLKISSLTDLSSLPVLLLAFSLLAFAVSPLTNAVSRYQEHKADEYAIHLTHDKKAAVSSFQKLTKAGLSQVDPPFLVKVFRYNHPTMLERITYIEEQ
ncbi:M48 family metallopeptidase [Priestia koreensis]|uniref:Peptidase M48 n=1 Tax=Priestia koreensis TaxID=284581 RepID=A0A0M0LH47_9BACI|nr:M48 family metallopeptidase [Priestia koreensis]KOO50242.1 peptidase M48 [Priestia koreensis]